MGSLHSVPGLAAFASATRCGLSLCPAQTAPVPISFATIVSHGTLLSPPGGEPRGLMLTGCLINWTQRRKQPPMTSLPLPALTFWVLYLQRAVRARPQLWAHVSLSAGFSGRPITLFYFQVCPVRGSLAPVRKASFLHFKGQEAQNLYSSHISHIYWHSGQLSRMLFTRVFSA